MQASGPTNTSAILSLLIPTSVQRPAASASSVALTGPSAAPPSAAPGTGYTASSATVGALATPALVAPPGTDPKLWSVLTSDEQHFFQQMAALGPLTYGARQSQAPPDAPLGQRIDVRG